MVDTARWSGESEGLNRDPDFAAACLAVDAARDCAYAELDAGNYAGLQQTLDTLGARSEELRRRYYPHSAELLVSNGAAVVVSSAGGRLVVWRRPPTWA